MTEEKKTPESSETEKVETPKAYEILHYSIDQQGNWNRIMLANWGAKEIVNAQTWNIVQERINTAKEQVLNGEMSPIGYFMVKCIMDVKLCGEFTGFSKSKVKKHNKPEYFKKLSQEILQRYAEVFEVTIDELVNLREKLKQELKNED